MKRDVRTIIVDADALIALFNEGDVHAKHSLELLDRLIADGAHILHPTTVIVEAVTTLHRRLNNPKAAGELVRVVKEAKLAVEPVNDAVLTEALALFNPHGSKQNTLFDAVVAAMARRLQADAIFSFDKWYEKQGFQLVTRVYGVQTA
ncbi:MAG: type II toxin-antitoxin system VapC family toxin [Ktedonobacterales bacterium]